ncbi:MAG: hypothetical protein KatS3mg001_610 [Candidatus Pacearchaeota archaeon]|nr:MAG: hypothetical protein KatS3mg001_610 [Candidatus Pacearchaeota archaeon]
MANLVRILKNISIGTFLTVGGLTSYLIKPLDPPEWYDELWKKMKECTGYEAKTPKYFLVKLKGIPCFLEKKCDGLYVAGGFIFLSEEAVKDSSIIMHEQAHALGIGWFNDNEVNEYIEKCYVAFSNDLNEQQYKEEKINYTNDSL